MPVYRARVVIKNPVLGGDGVNTWHLRHEAVIFDDTQMNQLMADLGDFYAAVKNELAAGTSTDFDGTVVRIDDDSQDIHTIDPWHVDSTTAAGTLPPATSIVVGWGTSVASRRGRGRTFLGPVNKNTLDSIGAIDSGTLTVLRDAADALIATFSGPADGAFGVWSREDNLMRDITSRTVHDKFAVLRSRRD